MGEKGAESSDSAPFCCILLNMADDDDEFWTYNNIANVYSTDVSCPVCGHPEGNCIPENHTPPEKIFGLGMFASLDAKQMFRVEQDVYEDVEFAPGHTLRVCVYRTGQQIPLSEARDKGLTTL